jgi:ABC-type transport system involved in cytochrome c biogenesis ATPase subunit
LEINIKPGNRLIVLGKKGQGKSSFLKIFIGLLEKIKGKFNYNGKITHAV